MQSKENFGKDSVLQNREERKPRKQRDIDAIHAMLPETPIAMHETKL